MVFFSCNVSCYLFRLSSGALPLSQNSTEALVVVPPEVGEHLAAERSCSGKLYLNRNPNKDFRVFFLSFF